jgi:hypothetical protein
VDFADLNSRKSIIQNALNTLTQIFLINSCKRYKLLGQFCDIVFFALALLFFGVLPTDIIKICGFPVNGLEHLGNVRFRNLRINHKKLRICD